MVTAKQKIKMLVFKKAIEEERQEHEYNHSQFLQVRWKQERKKSNRNLNQKI